MQNILFYTLLFLLPFTLSAQTWNGGNGSWNNAANWTPAVVPTSADIVTFNSGTSVVSGITGEAARLNVIAGADVTFDLDLNIGNLSSDNLSVFLGNNVNLTFGAGTFSILNNGGIDNFGISVPTNNSTLTVSSNAILNIGQSDIGIRIDNANAVFTNDGIINVSDYNSTGILINAGSGTNNGTITVNAPATTSSGDGFATNDLFDNNITGTITVTDANDFSLFVRGIFNNRGNINTDLQTNPSQGNASIKAQNATFINFNTGVINATAVFSNARTIFINLSTLNNFGTINASGGRTDQQLHLKNSTVTNDNCDAIINLIEGRLSLSSSIFTNNAYITSSYSDSGVHTLNGDAIATNNGFFDYTINSTVFATGTGVITDDGYTGPVSQATCEGDTDCENGDETWNAAICLCEHTPLIEEDASFTLTDFCEGAANNATITGTIGGNFTFNPAVTDGATINPATGEISNGVTGTSYTVEYTTTGICPNMSTQTVMVLSSDDASFTLTDFCEGAANNATISGTTGGNFAFNPAVTDGATIDAGTGKISNGVAGTTYTVEYTTTGTCPNMSTQTVMVLSNDDASFTLTDFCEGAANNATITGTTGGNFVFNPAVTDGAIINAATGEITNGVAGTTYTVEYTTTGTCPNMSTQTVMVLSSDDASFTLTDFCEGAANNATITGTTGGNFVFNPAAGDGATIDAGTGEISNGVAGTTYTVEYTTTGTCPNMSTQTVMVLSSDDASFTLTDFCEGAANNATITGTTGGNFVFNPAVTDGAIINAATGEITNGVAGTTYTVEYTTTGTCPNMSTQTVMVLASDDASFTLTDFCEGAANNATITGTTGGNFVFNPAAGDGATIDAGTGEISNGVAGTTYTVEYTTTGTCPNMSTQTVMVLSSDDASFTLTDFCEGAANNATITGTTGGNFVFNPAAGDGATIDAGTGEISNGVGGTDYIVQYATTGNCPDMSTQTVMVLSSDDASFTLTDFCEGAANNATISGTIGGNFTFNPAVTDGATINPATGEISNGVGGTDYIVQYTTTGNCPNMSTQTVMVLSSDDASFTLTDFCEGAANNATISGTTGGNFVFNPAVTDGATIDAGTGEISNGVAGTTYTVEYTTTGTCPNMSTQTVMVLSSDDASFTLTDFCEGAANNATISGTIGGNFTFNPAVTDGATINPATGEISNGVTGTSYTVEYTTTGTCPNMSTQTVMVLSSDDASFTLTDFCEGAANNATISGTTGGNFAFNPAVTDGATIDAGTGEISNGVAGTTYTVEYTTTGTCPNMSTQTVMVLSSDDASFTLTDFCEGAANNATITGTTGGNFVFNPAVTDGATIDAGTGEISNGVAGTTYTVEYTTTGTCPNMSTQTVMVLASDDASFTLTDFCEGAANNATISGTTGGTFTFNPAVTDGATIDAGTGEISNGVAGTTYTVEYTTTGTCPNMSTQTVMVLSSDDASFTLTDFCEGAANNATITGTTGGNFVFNPAAGDGATIDAGTGEISNGVGGTDYIVQYATTGNCPDMSTQTVMVLSSDDASFTLTDFCEGAANNATISGTIGGNFTFNPAVTDGATINPATGEISNGVGGTDYIVQYTTTGNCPNMSTQTVMVLSSDDASFTLTDFCEGAANNATISGTIGGNFTFNPAVTDGATINPATGEISNGVTGTSYTVEYTTTGTCPNMSTQTVMVLSSDDASFTLTDFCEGAANNATISGTTGGNFAFNPAVTDGATIDAGTGEISNGVAGTTYTVEYTTTGTCPNMSTQTVMVLSSDDASFTLTDFCEGAANNATITGTTGGNFVFNPAVTDGATIDAGTGEISNGVAGTTYTVEYTTTGTCPNMSTQTVMVLASDDASFTLTDFCEGAANNATISGTTGGTFTFNPAVTDGATIDAGTGEISNGVAGTTYTVEYTTTGTCPNMSTQTVMVLSSDDASFTLTDFCEGAANNATITGTTGGNFVFNPAAGDGATIDAGTGEISNGVGGTDYIVQYATTGNCPDMSTQTVMVLSSDDASFTLTDFCEGAANNAIITGTAGGSFAFNPAVGDGATINAGTGTITNGVGGTNYTVEYTTNGTCPSSSTETVTVNALDVATASIPDFCAGTDSPVATITGTTGGTFSFNPFPVDGATINMATGVISGGTSGTTYSIDYTTPAAGCQAIIPFQTTAQSDVNSGIAEPTPSFCEGEITLVDLTALLTGEDGGGTWNSDTDGTINISNPSQVNISTLGGGNYDFTYTVEALAPCTNASTTVSITINTAPSITNSSVTDVLCSGDNTGAIDLTALGSNLDYDWTGTGVIDGQANQTGLTAGNYSVTITDTNTNCFTTEDFTIDEPTDVVIDCTNPTNETAPSAEDGTVTVVFSGGTPTYSISYIGTVTSLTDLGVNTSPLLISGLAPDDYVVTLTDMNGCQETCTFTINSVGCDLSLSEITTDVLCADDMTGEINVTVGGVPNGTVTYNWNGDGTINGQEDQTGLAAGNYFLTISDESNCTATMSIEITEPTALVINNTVVENANCSLNNGSIEVIAAGGTGLIQYSLDAGAFTATNLFENLAAGNHDLIVQDANNCQTSQLINVPNDGTPAITMVNTTNATCGLLNGAIEIIASGGLAPLAYEVDGNGFGANNNFAGLASGFHDIIVQDANGCQVSQMIEIFDEAAPSIDMIDVTNSTCGAATGSITITASEGTAPLMYSITGIGGLQTNNIFGLLSAGNYTVLVQDANNCQATELVTIQDDGSPTIDEINVVNASCGLANGSLTVVATGGVAPLMYSITGVGGLQADNVFSDLVAANYDVLVEDATGCQTTLVAVVQGSSAPVIADIIIVDASCGLANGSLEIIITGGTADFMYSINAGLPQSSNIFNGLEAGDFNILVTDANDCSVTGMATINNNPAAVIDDVVLTHTTCGNDNGIIEITASGGTNPLLYSIGGGYFPSNIFNDVAVGDYTVEVLDDNGCSITQDVTINDSNLPSIDDVIITPSACMLSVGSIEIIASNGVAPLMYSITGGAPYFASNIFDNLPAANYDISVQDATGCVFGEAVVLGEVEPIGLVCAQNAPATTVGGTEGIGQVNIMGGTAPYTVGWNGGSLANQAAGDVLIPNLAAANYNLTVTDANGCEDLCDFTINGPGCNLTISDVSTNVTCNGAGDGTITVTIDGAADPITYVWDNGGTTATLIDLIPGTYNLAATDANNCPIVTSIEITEPNDLVITCDEQTPATLGNSDGIGVVNISGGTSNYTVEWTGGGILTNQSAGAVQMTDLATGNYTVTVTDANDCIETCDFTINEPNCALSISETHVNVLCNGDETGSIDVTITGATAPIVYDWNGGAFDTEDLTDIPAGAYNLSAIDANDCPISISVMITEETPIVVACSEVSPPTTIGGTDGVGQVNLSGGVAPYSIDWGLGTLDNLPTGITQIPNLPCGDYTVTVTDANNCETTCIFTVNCAGCDLSISETHVNVLCNGDETGSIDVTITGATAPIVYDWNGGAFDTEDLTDIPAGAYNLSAIDANDCPISISVMITEETPIVVACSEVSPPTTIGGTDGVGQVNLSGGVAPYSIDWGLGTLDNLPTGITQIPNLPCGDYTVTVTDANDCETTCTFNITCLDCDLDISETHVNVLCNGDETGSIDVTITGATTPIVYNWNGGAFDTEDLTDIPAGTYNLNAIDANDCPISISVMITEETPIVVACSEVSPPTTIGGTDGVGQVNLSGGVAPYSIDWGLGTLDNLPTGITQIPNLPCGDYTVTVTDANNCETTCTFNITCLDCNLNISETHVNVLCNGDETGSIDVTITGATAPIVYDWNGGAFDTEDLTDIPAGTYNLNAIDANDCPISISVTITEETPIVVACSEVSPPTTIGGTDGVGQVNLSGGVAPYSIDWGLGTLDNLPTGITQIPNLPCGDYTVTVTDANNCETTCIFTVNCAGCDLSISETHVNVLCNGDETGSIDVTITGATAPIVYDWNGGAFDTEDLTDIPAGAYNLSAIDANDCPISISVMITEETPIVVACSEVSPPTTIGGTDGVGQVNLSGGVAPYSIDWGLGTLDNLPTGITQIPNLPCGDYTVTVTDANNCETTCIFTVNCAGCDLSISETHVNVLCNGDETGSIDVTITGATAPIVYDWNGGAFDTEDLTDIPAGAYNLSAIDANDCPISISVMITEETPIVVACSEVSPPTTIGGTDGVGQVNLSGGVAPYSIDWGLGTLDNLPTGITQIPNLPCGDYTVTVTDANNCETTCIFTVNCAGCDLSISETHVNVLCNGDETGSIDVTITGATTPIVYNWNGGAFDTEDLTDIPAGTYNLNAIDANDCPISISVTITEEGLVDPGCDDNICENGIETWNGCDCIDGTPPVDPGCDDGVCTNGVETWDGCECIDGTPPVDPGNCDDGDCTNGIETWNGCECVDGTPPVDPGNCDDGDCTNGIETWNGCECIDGTPPIDPGNCDDGDCTNGIETWDGCECVDGTPPVDPGNCDDGDCTNGIETWDGCECIDGTPPVPCTDDGDCTNGTEVWDENICECLQTNIPDPTTCIDDGDCTNGIETYNTNTCECDALPANCDNAPTTALPCDDGDECTINDVEMVSDCDGTICIPCIGEPIDNSNIFAENDEYEVIYGAAFEENVLTNDLTDEFEEVIVQLTSEPQNGTLTLNTDGTFTYQANNPLAETDEFIYEFCAAECPEICATATVNLTITLDDIIIPDAISPNGDGLNDTWIIPGLLQRDTRKMMIINRWGSVLFDAESYENDWNGNNKEGKPLPEGTYYYYLDMGADFGTREGPITIIR